MIYIIHTDGGSRGNPGPAAIGVVIETANAQKIHAFGKTIGVATNNIAEYQAVVAALEWLISSEKRGDFHFFLDSQLVVNQLNGIWKIKDANLRGKIILIRQLEATLNCQIKYVAVPREQNTAADRLVNLALDHKL